MANVLGGPGEQTHADEAECFDRWLCSKSFSMLTPVCRLGLAVVTVLLLLVDPLLHRTGVWGADPQHAWMVAWHACASVYFLAFLLASKSRFGASHRHRMRCLVAFFAAGAVLFTWFGFISWMLSGDLSTYAIFVLTMVCVFCFPGALRKVLNLASAASLALLVLWLDDRQTFHTSVAAINLVALAIVSLMLEIFLMRLNLALYREKHLVEFERARADRVLYNALPMSIADELKSNRVVKARKYPRMTVLFVDIVGFTEFSAALPPDKVVQVLNEIFSEFDSLADEYEVEKIKTIGDAYMVIGKDNPSSVASLALELLGAVRSYNRRNSFELAIRGGMHVGPTVAGVIGLKRLLYDVWGDAVNTASRMESTGDAGRIQVSEEIFTELRGNFRFEPRGEMQIKGKGPMRTYFMLGHRLAHELA